MNGLIGKEKGIQSKADKLRAFLAGGNERKAVMLASRFFDRSEATEAAKEAASAILSPAFYKQIGKDPVALETRAVELLRAKFC